MQCIRKMVLIPVLLLPVATAFSDDVVEPEADGERPTEAAELLLETSAFAESAALSDDELNAHRARENIEIEKITVNEQTQDGDVTDNVAINNTNGDNLINGDAFSGSSGFMSTVQNTGNNVLIQNSTIINVSVDAPSN